jgi:hypothetical protein
MWKSSQSHILAPTTLCAQSAEPSAAELSRLYRNLILPSLPTPLVEQKFNWDHLELAASGLRWEKKGILYKPEVTQKLQNDGVWRKISVAANNPETTLLVSVKDVKTPEPGKMTFSIDLELPVKIDFVQQFWHSGIRLYSGETRGRCRTLLHLVCESTARVEKQPGALLPDVIFRMRVTDAKLNYYDFVVEHTLGIGGDAAKFLGNAVHETIKQWRPSLERNLLEKANKAIVKAGDTKEIRLSLSKLMEAKK